MELGMFYGVAGTAVEGVGLLFPTRQAMKNPSNFRAVFLWTAGFIILFYMFFGLTGSLVGVTLSLIGVWLHSQGNHVLELRFGVQAHLLHRHGVRHCRLLSQPSVSVSVIPYDDPGSRDQHL